MTTNSPAYVCVIGFDYEPKRGTAVRVDADETVPKLPAKVIAHLIAEGCIVEQADA